MAVVGKTKIENLYSRFTDGFLGELRSDEFYEYFINSVKSGECTLLWLPLWLPHLAPETSSVFPPLLPLEVRELYSGAGLPEFSEWQLLMPNVS